MEGGDSIPVPRSGPEFATNQGDYFCDDDVVIEDTTVTEEDRQYVVYVEDDGSIRVDNSGILPENYDPDCVFPVRLPASKLEDPENPFPGAILLDLAHAQEWLENEVDMESNQEDLLEEKVDQLHELSIPTNTVTASELNKEHKKLLKEHQKNKLTNNTATSSGPSKRLRKDEEMEEEDNIKENEPIEPIRHKWKMSEPLTGRNYDKAMQECLSDDDEEDDDSEEEEDPKKLWCICRQPYNNRFMISCDACEEWFHGACVGVTKAKGKIIEKSKAKWFCPSCKKAKRQEKKVRLVSGKKAATSAKII